MIKLTQILKEIKISSHNSPINWLKKESIRGDFNYELDTEKLSKFILNDKIYNSIRTKYNLNLNDEELKEKLEDYINNEADEVHEDPEKMEMWSKMSLNNIIEFFENYIDYD